MSIARHAIGRRLSARFTTRAAILSVVVGALLLASIFPIRTWLSERSQIAQDTRQVATLEQQIAGLDAKIRKYQNPSYLEQLARECLGMVKPGEVPFVIVPKHGAPKPASC